MKPQFGKTQNVLETLVVSNFQLRRLRNVVRHLHWGRASGTRPGPRLTPSTAKMHVFADTVLCVVGSVCQSQTEKQTESFKYPETK